MDVALKIFIIDKFNHLHEWASRIVYSDYTSSFEKLFNKENSFSIHERNIQSLAIEIYKFLNGLYTGISSACHSYVLVYQSYVTRMYSYVIRTSLVCDSTVYS